MSTFPVKWYETGMPGYPQWDETIPESVIAVFKACLIDGFGNVTTLSANHNNNDEMYLDLDTHSGEFQKYQVVKLSGCSDSNWDGEYRVIEVETDRITLKIDTIHGTIGTPTISIPPVGGWEIQFQNGPPITKAVFRSTDHDATGCIFYLDSENNNTYHEGHYMTFYAAEKANSLTEHINTYSGNYNHISIGDTRANGPIPFLLIADSKFVYVRCPATHITNENDYSPSSSFSMVAVGDFINYKPGDKWNHIHQGSYANSDYRSNCWSDFGRLDNSNRWKIARSSDQLAIEMNGGPDDAGTYSSGLIDHYSHGGFSFPEFNSRSMILEYVYINGKRNNELRGRLPGIYAPLHDNLHNYYSFDNSSNRGKYVVKGLKNDPNALIMLVTIGLSYSSRSTGYPAFDIQGPWR